MSGITNLLSTSPYIYLPYHLLGWIGWLGMCAVLIWLQVRYWEKLEQISISMLGMLILLMISVPLTTLFFGLPLNVGKVDLMPGIPAEQYAPVMVLFAALPWVLAGGILGPLYGTLFGILSGLFISFWGTHSLFTPLEIGGLALLFSLTVRQRYRTKFFSFVRHPLFAAVFCSVVYIPIFLFSGFFSVRGSFINRMDFALTQSWYSVLARGGELIIAGFVAEILYLLKLNVWGKRGALIPAPSEKNLQKRFFSYIVPMMLVIFFTLLVSDWVVAGNVAKDMLKDQLSSSARVVADNLPYFFEASQSSILTIAKEDLLEIPRDQLYTELGKRLRGGSYFRQLYLFDLQGNPIMGYPEKQISEIYLTPEEKAGIRLAVNGVQIQTYTVSPLTGENTAQISFIASIIDEAEGVTGVLLGRTDFNSNPFTQPAIEALKTINFQGGEGLILDENRRILYHSEPSQLMEEYLGYIPEGSKFIEDTSAYGTRQYGFSQPVTGRPWVVLLTVPADQTQSTALKISVPLLGILFALFSITFILLRVNLRKVTVSLESLANETALIAQGHLDHPLEVEGIDEIGRFGGAFEQMRVGLKARLDELNRLLKVSQSVAENLEVDKAVQPILEAALGEYASSARIVLIRGVSPNSTGSKYLSYGTGISNAVYSYLDEQIFELMRNKDMLTVPNTIRMRLLQFSKNEAIPGSFGAVSLRHENEYFGILWVAYDTPHLFSEEESRFLSTIGGQASMAAVNALLFASADVGRQRLQAVLDSTPEPVLVTDEQNRLLLLNPAVLQISGLVTASTPGRKIEEVIAVPELLKMMSSPVNGKMSSREITLPNGRAYFASISEVHSEGQSGGRVCILQDITHYKELDNLKSEFVATVSHDLRSPLTLMRGYATMLQMVGELNDQQKEYVQKILYGTDNMAKLVSNLLDIGRIEAGIGLNIKKISADELVDQVVNSLQPQANQKHIQVTKEKSEMLKSFSSEILIEADPALVNQALYNLVDNAIKYTLDGGKVEIKLGIENNSVVFEVQDNGIGVAPLDLPHMFEKFYRSGRREAYSQRGTGLGLAIVKSIVERHGGRVWVDSHLGKGSSFCMAIPLLQKSEKASKIYP